MTKRRLAAITIAAGVACLPAAASATSGLITVQSVSSPASDLGDLSVTLESATPVVPGSISATFYPQGSQAAALRVTGFALTSGQNTGGTVTTWTIGSPVTVGQLPLGTYRVEIQAADTGGDTTDDQNAETLAWIGKPQLTLTVTPSAYALGQPVTLAGTDIAQDPDGTTQPMSGQVVTISDLSPGGLTATTDATGHYSIQTMAGGPLVASFDSSLYAFVQASPGFDSAYSPPATITIEQDPIRVTTFSYSPRTMNFGSPVTVSGDVSFESGGTWLPYAAEPISVTFGGVNLTGCPPGNCSSDAGDTATAADGSFTVTIPGSAHFGTDALSFGVGGGWLSSLTTTFDVQVNHVPTQLYVSYLRRDIHGRIHLAACINPRASFVLPQIEAPYPAAKVQYAARPGGPWQTLAGAAALPDYQLPPRHPGFCYRATERSPSSAVYYRVLTPASSAYTAAVSNVERAGTPARTRIKDFAVRPPAVSRGQRVHVSGQLFELACVKLQVLFRPDGGSSWRVLKRVQVTGDNGNWGPFATSVVPPRSGDMRSGSPGRPSCIRTRPAASTCPSASRPPRCTTMLMAR